jgi:hypothetical protein
LRTLQTLAEVAVEKNSTLVFPIPSEVMDAFRAVAHHFGPEGSASAPTAPITPPLPAPPTA